MDPSYIRFYAFVTKLDTLWNHLMDYEDDDFPLSIMLINL